eukprot:GILK01012202.1.p1 GENE.GILK01012202.1~~GILK01012202.1.p1  ORF type:complete len:674 (+),score=89.87 GILK01012202.1:74-2095(+)
MSGRSKWEQLAKEFVVKSLEVVLQSRIANLLGESGRTPKKTQLAFQLDIEESGKVRDVIKPFTDPLNEPKSLILDIFVDVSDRVLLERWICYYEPLPESQVGSDRNVYKKAVIMLRALACLVRALPAFAFYKASRKARSSLEPSLSHTFRLDRTTPLTELSQSVKDLYEFPAATLDSTFGRLTIKTLYRKDPSYVPESSQPEASANMITTDFVIKEEYVSQAPLSSSPTSQSALSNFIRPSSPSPLSAATASASASASPSHIPSVLSSVPSQIKPPYPAHNTPPNIQPLSHISRPASGSTSSRRHSRNSSMDEGPDRRWSIGSDNFNVVGTRAGTSSPSSNNSSPRSVNVLHTTTSSGDLVALAGTSPPQQPVPTVSGGLTTALSQTPPFATPWNASGAMSPLDSTLMSSSPPFAANPTSLIGSMTSSRKFSWNSGSFDGKPAKPSISPFKTPTSISPKLVTTGFNPVQPSSGSSTRTTQLPSLDTTDSSNPFDLVETSQPISPHAIHRSHSATSLSGPSTTTTARGGIIGGGGGEYGGPLAYPRAGAGQMLSASVPSPSHANRPSRSPFSFPPTQITLESEFFLSEESSNGAGPAFAIPQNEDDDSQIGSFVKRLQTPPNLEFFAKLEQQDMSKSMLALDDEFEKFRKFKEELMTQPSPSRSPASTSPVPPS